MLARVLAALDVCADIDECCICGIDDPALTQSNHAHLADTGSIVANVQMGLRWALEQSGAQHVVVVTADLACVSAESITHFIALCRPLTSAGYYSMVPRAAIEARYPDAQRTYTKLRDLEVTGGNIAILHTDLLDTDPQRWAEIVHARKHAWQMARRIGPRTLIKLATRRLTVADTGDIATKLFGHSLQAVVTPYAELGMDVDKPQHIEMLRRLLTPAQNHVTLNGRS